MNGLVKHFPGGLSHLIFCLNSRISTYFSTSVELLIMTRIICSLLSNVEGDAGNLELGQEVEYTLASRTGPGGKVSAENVRVLTKGTLPMPKVSTTCSSLTEESSWKYIMEQLYH